MEVAIIYCKECVFSQNTGTIILGHFTKMNNSEFESVAIDVKFYELREIEHQTIAVSIRKSNVKIIIISHPFLEQLATVTMNKQRLNLNRILNSNGGVIAVLVQVSQDEILQSYGQFLPHLGEWNILDFRTSTLRGVDSHFYKIFSEQVIRSYNVRRSYSQRRLQFRTRDPGLSPPIDILYEDTPFLPGLVNENKMDGKISIISTEVIPEHRKLIITLDKQVNSGDTVKIELKKSNPEKNEGERVFVISFQIPELLGQSDRDDSFNIEIASPTTVQGPSGSRSDTYTEVLESTIQKLPTYRKCLDEHISEILSKHFKDGSSFEADHELDIILDIQKEKSLQFPTLMHLVVHYGLERTVWTLLEEGNGIDMCEIQNCNSQTPLNIAEIRGFSLTIGKTIQDYKEVMKTWEALHYMKVLCEAYGLRKPSTGNLTFCQVNQVNPDTQANATVSPSSNKDSSKDIQVQRDLAPRPTPVEGNSSRFLPDVVIGTDGEDSPPALQPRRASTSGHTHCLSRCDSWQSVSSFKVVETTSPNPENNSHDTSEVAYSVPPALLYSIPPEPKPILPPKKYKKQMELPHINPSTLLKKDGTIPRCTDGYILMHELEVKPESPGSSKEDLTESEDDENAPNQPRKSTMNHRATPSSNFISSKVASSSQSLSHISNHLLQKPSCSTKTGCLLDSTDVELLEMMIGVKQHAISLTEVEEFFSVWKDRTDVQQNYIEKQKDLELMRAEYARIQAQQPTQWGNQNLPLFDRLFKIFVGKTRHKKISSPTEFIENIDSSSRVQADYPNSVEPPPLLQRKELVDTDRVKSPSSERVWGNAMCRKHVAASYICPSSFNDSNRDSEVYKNLEAVNTSQIFNHSTSPTDPDGISCTNEEIETASVNMMRQDKNVSLRMNFAKLEREKNNLDREDILPKYSPQTQFSPPIELDCKSISFAIPPPIPPKKKDMKLSIDMNANAPVPLPRRMQKESSLHFIKYEMDQIEGKINPDYTNSPNDETISTPT